jgi:hypothetical protein
MPELTITSLMSTSESTPTHLPWDNPMPESSLTLCFIRIPDPQSIFSEPVQEKYGFQFSIIYSYKKGSVIEKNQDPG